MAEKFCSRIINPLFDGLTYVYNIMSGHFANCLHFSSPLWGSKKYYTTCKISVRIIQCTVHVKPSNKVYVHCTKIFILVYLTIDWKKCIMSRYSRGLATFGGLTTFGIYQQPQSFDVTFRGSLLSGDRYFRSFTESLKCEMTRKMSVRFFQRRSEIHRMEKDGDWYIYPQF